MPPLPRERSFDSTLALLRDPYHFIARRCRAHGADAFQARLLLQHTIFVTGPDAARLFYDPDKFVRAGAAPEPVQRTLFGKGGVQATDGDTHRQRKAMLLSILTGDAVDRLAQMMEKTWLGKAGVWETAGQRVTLYPALQEIITRAVCAWAGVPLDEGEIGQRTRQLAALFDYAASKGPGHLYSRLQRKRANAWAADVIERTRAGALRPPAGSVVEAIAAYREHGQPPSPHLAAVELLNVLRPTVAVSVFVVFVAHALHEHPECRRRLASGERGYDEWFVQEVRRFYPFFPAVVARVRDDFEWRGFHFAKGTRVVLDLHGTNRDPRAWEAPDVFNPERFRAVGDWMACPFSLIPQGGGEHATGHRCPGEWITIAMMKTAARLLTSRIAYDVPEQDLHIDDKRMPPLPRSRFVIENVRVT